MSSRDLVMSDFYCVFCMQKNLPVWRHKGSSREAGHLKKLYCLNCKKETNNIEIRPFGSYTLDDFIIEEEYDNFDANGNRKMTYGELRKGIHNGYIKQKKEVILDGRNPRFGQKYLDI